MHQPSARRLDAVSPGQLGRQLRLARLVPFIPRLEFDEVLLPQLPADRGAVVVHGHRLPFFLDFLQVARDRPRTHPELKCDLLMRTSFEVQRRRLPPTERAFNRSELSFLFGHDLSGSEVPAPWSSTSDAAPILPASLEARGDRHHSLWKGASGAPRLAARNPVGSNGSDTPRHAPERMPCMLL